MEKSDSAQKAANSEQKIEEKQPTSYQEWIQQAQVSRNANWKLNVAIHESVNTEGPPKFDKVLFDSLICTQGCWKVKKNYLIP